MEKLRKHSKKVGIGIVGGLVVLLGLVLVPYPGPGWLVVFGGLAILATEFDFAAKALDFAKGKYDAWVNWLKQQNLFVRIAVLAFTGAVVLLTLWLLKTFGLVANLFNLPYDWLRSPFIR